MSTNITMSILGLYEFDNTIFDNMVLPAGLEIDTMKNNILMECAELETLYPNPSFMKTAIGFWSRGRLQEWERVNTLYEIDMSPANEYDYTRTLTGSRNTDTDEHRTKSYDLSDRKTGTDTKASTGTQSTETESEYENSNESTDTKNLTDTDKVSAYNSSTFENRAQSTHTGTDGVEESNSGTAGETVTRTDNLTDTATYNSNTAKTGTEDDQHNGNEDTAYSETVTESGHKGFLAKAVKDALEIKGTIYDYICEDFKQRFCVLVY